MNENLPQVQDIHSFISVSFSASTVIQRTPSEQGKKVSES